ncbi:hypothetical protein RJT34_30918 [Clitoria ternatea]|uniref:RNase H type-1 domain-containing protein n=1 Tax=Clitoria ternatea TaxID=43366 RepID=A0AAN9EVE7_CLITE
MLVILKVELLAISTALRLAWSWTIHIFTIKINAQKVGEIIFCGVIPQVFAHRDILHEILAYLKRDWSVSVLVISRECNYMANALALHERFSGHLREVWDSPPPTTAMTTLLDFLS